MYGIGKLVDDHEQLEQLAGELTVLARHDVPAPLLASELIEQFAQARERHEAVDATVLHAETDCGQPSRFEAAVLAYRRDHGYADAAWMRYYNSWTREKIERDWSGFARATLIIMDAERTRMAHEDRVLYPMALQANRVRLRAA